MRAALRHAKRDVAVDEAAAAATVSSAWLSGVSPSSTAAAMPPCARKDEPLYPTGVGAKIATGVGASFSAQNTPGKPAADDENGR